MTLFKAAKLSDVIRRKSWNKNVYFVYGDKLGFSCIIFEESDNSKANISNIKLTKDDLFATDWEVKF